MNNKLLVTADSIRYDHFHLMKNTRKYLQNEHDSTFSVSTATPSSFPGIMYSQYPTKYISNSKKEFTSEIEAPKFGITTNHLLSERYGYGESFDYFECPRSEDKGIKTKVAKTFDDGSLPYRIMTKLWNRFQNVRQNFTPVKDSFRSDEDVIAELIDKISDEDEWFAWIHLMEPHHPYEPDCGDRSKVEYQNKTRKAINGNATDKEKNIVCEGYKNEIIEMDESLNELWNFVPDDTEIIFTSDHGELLGEYNDNWGHPGMMVPELLHVPFATKNIDIPNQRLLSHIDIGSLFLDEDFGMGDLQRKYAYATYGNEKAVITSEIIYDGERAIDMNGDIVENYDDISKVTRKWSNFSPDSSDYKQEAMKEDLEKLGYL